MYLHTLRWAQITPWITLIMDYYIHGQKTILRRFLLDVQNTLSVHFLPYQAGCWNTLYLTFFAV